MKMYLLLDNIRSAHNVGSIFRTADCVTPKADSVLPKADVAGVNKIYLCGYTPAPVDRFLRPVNEVAKVALGAEKNVQWERCKDILELIQKLKQESVQVIALEQNSRAINYRDFRLKEKFALIVGNEVDGIEKEILDQCDAIIEIPMKGAVVRQAHHPHRTRRGKESLNVAVATGIALFHFL